jgi:hypothetical protein
MWLEKFLDLISRILPSDPVSGLQAELAQLDPDKIYVENVRSILHVSTSVAERVLETAVRQGVFQKGVEVRCPDGAVAATADSEKNLPRSVHCWHELDGDMEEIEVATDELSKVTFYKLNDKPDAAAVLYR